MTASIETWTAPRDFRLRRLRREGASWETIAEELAVSPAAASARADRIGAPEPAPGQNGRDDPAREPLPAGHQLAWGVLTQGTWLAGSRYPAPASQGSLS